MFDLALLILRIVVGAYLFAHGAQKLFGWFGGGGLAGTTAMTGALRFRPARAWAVIAGLSEATGAMLVLGFLTPLAAASTASAMLTATFSAHLRKGWFNTKGGPELPITNLAVVAAVALLGPGRISLDYVLGFSFPEPVTVVVLAVLVVVGVAGAFALRRAEERTEAEGTKAQTA
ncbi:MAG TPA: DoxX family protein [Candidatus Dormibacteraeota bacterium]